MATVGNTTTPGHNWVEQGVNTPPNQMATAFTMPQNGTITALHAYFALVAGGSATAWCCLWDASGNLLRSAAVSVPNGSASVGGQQWNSGSVSPIFIASGATIYLGFSVAEANGFYMTDESSGSSIWNTQSSAPGSLNGNSGSGHLAVGAYADYNPTEAWVWNGSSWVANPLSVWNGSSWASASGLLVWNGSSWVNAT